MAARSSATDKRSRLGGPPKARRPGPRYRVRARGSVPDDLCDRISSAHASAIRGLPEGERETESARPTQRVLRERRPSFAATDSSPI